MAQESSFTKENVFIQFDDHFEIHAITCVARNLTYHVTYDWNNSRRVFKQGTAEIEPIVLMMRFAAQPQSERPIDLMAFDAYNNKYMRLTDSEGKLLDSFWKLFLAIAPEMLQTINAYNEWITK